MAILGPRNAFASAALAVAAVSSGAALAAPCSGFSDVDSASPFCANVEWITNRAITLGCAAGLYCPGDPVSRLAMAAFMHRLGSALTPTIVRGESLNAVIVGEGIVCRTQDVPARSYPGTATVHARFTGTVSGSADWAATFIVVSYDQGVTWGNASAAQGPVGPFSSAAPATLSDTAVVDVPPGQPVRFGLRLATEVTESARGSCSVLAAIGNRNGTAPPR